MDIKLLLDSIKKHPDYDRVGMILCHNGRRQNAIRIAVLSDYQICHLLSDLCPLVPVICLLLKGDNAWI